MGDQLLQNFLARENAPFVARWRFRDFVDVLSFQGGSTGLQHQSLSPTCVYRREAQKADEQAVNLREKIACERAASTSAECHD